VPEELNSYFNKRIYVPSNLTSQEIQNEIDQIEQHLNMSNTVKKLYYSFELSVFYSNHYKSCQTME
jgi:hypothetical protein